MGVQDAGASVGIQQCGRRCGYGEWQCDGAPLYRYRAAIPPLVALARMYRGMHHPTDALAGMLLGIGALLLALLAARAAGAVSERRESAQ